jgi:alcohol dehydrogenase class IV
MKPNVFELLHTTKIIHGQGSLQRMAERLKANQFKTSLIVTDAMLVKAGLVDKIVDALNKQEIRSVVYPKVEPNPTAESVDEGAQWVKEHQIDNIIALGGGSSIDCAKGIAILAENGGAIRDYEGFNTWSKEKMFLTAIPTTVGTGSEVTFGAVITDKARKLKMIIAGEDLSPKLAVLEPDLVAKLPSQVTAATGMDALTQAIEGYISSNATPITDALNIYAVKAISQSLRAAVWSNDYDALATMQISATIAGIGFINGGLGIVHAMSNTIGGIYGTPHGITNAVLLPYGMEYNLPTNLRKFADIAQAMGENIEGLSLRDAAEKAIDAVKRLSKDLGIPEKLSDLGVTDEHIDLMSELALDTPDIKSNPRHYSKQTVAELYYKAL